MMAVADHPNTRVKIAQASALIDDVHRRLLRVSRMAERVIAATEGSDGADRDSGDRR